MAEYNAEGIRSFLLQHPPFNCMERADLDFLVEQLKPVRFGDGEAIVEPSAGPAEWFYVLRNGRVIGEEQSESASFSDYLGELMPGECFPLGALSEGRPVRNALRAEGNATCLTMNRASFRALRHRSQTFDSFCVHQISELMEQARPQVQAEAVRDMRGDTSLDIMLKERRLRDPLTCRAEASIRTALEGMAREKVGSIVVVDPAAQPIGIFTMKDLLNRVALGGVPLDTAMERVMTRDPVGITTGAFAFEAAMMMADHGIHHLCVVEDGRLVGVVSERDLFSLQRVGLVNLTKSVARANTVEELARIAADIHQLVAQMMAQGVKVGQITQMITLLNDHIVGRLLDLSVAESPEVEGIDFVWIAFGSEGRQEQTLKTDQDNGILFVPQPGQEVATLRARLLPFADRVNRALDTIGFTLCPAEIMARNPDCCLSGEEWRNRFAGWIDGGTPEHLLKASIFFDFRFIWGIEEPVGALREWLMKKAAVNTRFQRQMAENALRNTPPLGGPFRDFRVSGQGNYSGTIDLKINGVAIFIDAARIWALNRQVSATATVERLKATATAGAISAGDLAAWTDAYDFIRMLRMRVNQEQAVTRQPLTNRVAPNTLNDLDRRILKEAFREARRLQARLALDYQL